MIVVTRASGFSGATLLRRLVASGEDVTGVDHGVAIETCLRRLDGKQGSHVVPRLHVARWTVQQRALGWRP